MDLFPRPCPWLPSDLSPLQAKIVRTAHADIGICEIPPGSNRSTIIDEYMRLVGSPVPADPHARGMSWCAAALSAWYSEAGAKIPAEAAGAVQTWITFAQKNGLWLSYSETPEPGFAIVYGTRAPDEGHHIGVVGRVTPWIETIEGNTSKDLTYTSDGECVWVKAPQAYYSRVIGFIRPVVA